ncbi:MAG: sugar phosphate nucleotidyltransferase [Acidobacteriota bacterium]|nr:sugar phosphate nucleotidyltransferase [Acidobacteriota bacterium]
MSRYGLILAGGRGTRFWPQSRKKKSKQVLNIAGERTMIQATVDRLKPRLPPDQIWVLTNGLLRDEIIRQLPEVPKAQILAEPEQRNTAAAIGLAAHILHSLDPEAVMGVFPADHVIDKPKRYLKMVTAAFAAAEQGSIAVLGIAPRWPETGYGYVEFPKHTVPGSLEPSAVKSFREKPDLKTAKHYVKKGNFYWNAGMFFWRADTVLANLREHLPKTATLLSSLPAFRDRGFAKKLQAVFPLCENISVDYAILERAKNVVGLACDEIGWNDVGSWNAVYDLLPRDADKNVTRSALAALSSTGNYVDAGKKLVALIDVNDLIVVDTPDALLVANRHKAQQVADLVKLLEKRGSDELL